MAQSLVDEKTQSKVSDLFEKNGEAIRKHTRPASIALQVELSRLVTKS